MDSLNVLMREHRYEEVVRTAPNLWLSNRVSSDTLFKLITSLYQLKKYKDLCFWAKIYTSLYPGGWIYSDVFSFWMESIYRTSKKSDAINLIGKEVELEFLKNGCTYHGMLYRASAAYMGGNQHMNDFEAAASMFHKNVARLEFSNNSLRGLQYLVAKESIEFISRKEAISNKKTEYFVKSKNSELFVWLVCLDSIYFEKYFQYLMKSYTELRGKFHLHIHIINPSEEQINILHSLSVSYSMENFFAKDPIPYYASSRFIILSELMDKYPGSDFMITDADVLIHDKIPLSLIHEDYDMAIRMKESELYPWRDMGAGLCMVKNNKRMRDFFGLFSKIFNDKYDPNKDPSRNTQWWIDQGILYSLINYFGDLSLRRIDSEVEKRFIFFPQGDKALSLQRAEKSYSKDVQ